jgi:Na+/H+-dicarboxylate symporter
MSKGEFMKDRVTQLMLPAMVLGVAIGAYVYEYLPEQRADIAANFNLVVMLFLRMIKMIIAPLVFATLVGGIANMHYGARLGRMFGRTMGWFIAASFVSLLLGLVMVNMLQPGANFPGAPPAAGQASGLQTAAFSLDKFLTHVVPTSIADAMAQNEILQIVVFSIFFAMAMRALPERSKAILHLVDDLACVMLKVTHYVMYFAPLAVFAALLATTAKNGLEVIGKLAEFVGGFYLALFILWSVLIALGFYVLRKRCNKLLQLIREPLVIAFSTSSSEAAFPKLLEALERFGVSTRVAGFVLPLGYSFNLDGSMMYTTFATIFIAQVYGIDMPLAQQMTMLLVLMVTSKGIAGVPRSALVVIAATLGQFGIPEAGLLLLLGTDIFFDMGRSATNVIGNAIATGVVAKWEGELGRAKEEVCA